MTCHQALASYTVQAAYAGFAEKQQGAIQTGKLADFTIFSQDIMTVPEDRLLSTQVDYTIVGEEVVYQRK
jgi:predicted amidohydrolase YtcJ